LFSHQVFKNVKIKIHKTVILSFILYGCESWSVTLREENRLESVKEQDAENTFGPKKEEVTGGC
jgi:hypothetical protein